MVRKYLISTLLIAAVVIPTRPGWAASSCDAGKVKCVAKRIGCLMKVDANALKTGQAPDAAKRQKCYDKFDGGAEPAKGCFAKLENKQDFSKPQTLCTTADDATAVAAQADALRTALVVSVSAENVPVSGTTRDYFTGGPAGLVELSTFGCGAELLTTSDAAGLYAFNTLGNGTLFVHAAKTTYRSTRNVGLQIGAEPVSTDFETVSNADVARQFATLGESAGAGTGLVFAEMVDEIGAPIEGVALGDITLLDQDGFPSADGPYFFGAAGDLVPGGTLATSTAFGGRARVGFLNCPPGPHDLTVFTAGGNFIAAVECIADGVTLVKTAPE